MCNECFLTFMKLHHAQLSENAKLLSFQTPKIQCSKLCFYDVLDYLSNLSMLHRLLNYDDYNNFLAGWKDRQNWCIRGLPSHIWEHGVVQQHLEK